MQERIEEILQTFKGRLNETRVNIAGQNVRNMRIIKRRIILTVYAYSGHTY